jgi:hypothetical protein
LPLINVFTLISLNLYRSPALRAKDIHTMTVSASENQTEQSKQNDKETNFRLQEKALHEKYERILAQERAEKAQLAKELDERSRQHSKEDDDDDSEPYVDHKRLNKKLAKFGEQTQRQTQTEIQTAVHKALAEERKQNWLKNNTDFVEVLKHADKFAEKDPELAESILEMPEGFERQKLVYKNIKALGLHKPEAKQPSIQEKIDANRRSPYYQPSSVGSAPYASAGDFSPSGQKNAYDKMQDLKKTLRL